MAEFNLKECWPRIVGFYPCYRPDGSNSTCIVFQDGSQYVDRRKTRTFLQSAAKIFSTDLTALRCNYQRFLGCKGMVPLPLHSNFILVPFKVRKPQYKDHGATGYAVLSQIRFVEETRCQRAGSGEEPLYEEPLYEDQETNVQMSGTNFLSRISMAGGITLVSLEKASTLNRRLGDAARVGQEYRRFYGGSNSFFPLENLIKDSFTAGPGVSKLPRVGEAILSGMLDGSSFARESEVSGTQELSGVSEEAIPRVRGVMYHIHFHTEGSSGSMD